MKYSIDTAVCDRVFPVGCILDYPIDNVKLVQAVHHKKEERIRRVFGWPARVVIPNYKTLPGIGCL